MPAAIRPLATALTSAQELRRGDVLPGRSAAGPAEHDRVAGLAGVGDDVVGEVAGGGDLDRQGRGELTHGASSSGAPRSTDPGRRRPRGTGGTRAHGAGYRCSRRGLHPVRSHPRAHAPGRGPRHRRRAPMAEQTTSSIVIDAAPADDHGRDRRLRGLPRVGQGRHDRRGRLDYDAGRRAGPRRAGLLRARRLPDQGRVHPRLRVGRRPRGHLDPGRGQDAARARRRLRARATAATARPR